MGLGWIKILIIVAVLTAVGGTVYAGYQYVVGLQEANAQLEKDKAKLVIAVDLKETELNSLQAGLAAMAKETVALNDALEASRKRSQKLKRVFDDHDFTKLLDKKPGLVESRMVAASERMRRAIEQASQD